jgi:hypothetical protein
VNDQKGLKTVCFWETLISLAREKGKAKLSGDADRLKKATEALEKYEELCMKADELVLPGGLYD